MVLREFVGSIHIHTTCSDGSGTIEEISLAAVQAGLDFVCISDHNQLIRCSPAEPGTEGPRARPRPGLVVVIGEEVNHKKNHYLAFGLKELVLPDDEHPQVVIDAVARQGGAGFIAHPFEQGSPYILGGRTYCWTDWGVRGYTGIEVWNMLSQLRDAMTTIPRLLWYGLVCPGNALTGPSPAALAAWDREAQCRKVVALGGADAHALRLGFGRLRFVFGSYGYAFRCVNMHLLMESECTGSAVVAALASGRSFVSLDLLGQGRGFRFWGERLGKRYEMGSTMGLHGATLSYELPARAGRCRVRLMCDGIKAAELTSHRGSVQPDKPGVYRLEVYKRVRCRWRAWIFSNPVWVA